MVLNSYKPCHVYIYLIGQMILILLKYVSESYFLIKPKINMHQATIDNILSRMTHPPCTRQVGQHIDQTLFS